MELTFVHQHSGDAPKRRRLAKACETCRARKKRCVHFQNEDRDDYTDATGADFSGSTDASYSRSTSDPAHLPTPPLSAGQKRFLSDLQPEALLLNRKTSRETDQGRAETDLGIWIDRREYEALVKQQAASTSASTSLIRNEQKPHPSALGPLVEVYFAKFHPILPLLDEEQFRREIATGVVEEALLYAMCLVAAKDTEAAAHLRLAPASVSSSSSSSSSSSASPSPPPLPPREFCTRMHASIMTALKATRFDKITLIRILALASMHNEGADGNDEAAMCLAQAMHHAQGLGIHLAQSANSREPSDMSVKRLFWCLWILDRENATRNGRPIVMAERDIAIETFEPGESGFPAFEVWLKITQLLNKVIDFYRPHQPIESTGWEDLWPDLESMLDEAKAWHLPRATLASIHLYFLTVSILSHRCRGVKQINRGTHSSIRQRVCAGEVVRFMETMASKDVVALPCIPYAISLSLSVSYQQLRQSQFDHQQEDGRRDFRSCTKILQQLRRTWCSVDTIAALAKRVLDELERAPSLAAFRIPRNVLQSDTMGAKTAVVEDLDQAIPHVTACAPLDHSREAVSDTRAAIETEQNHRNGVDHPHLPGMPSTNTLPNTSTQEFDLFDGMDDVFGTYLDPNYPLHLEDMSFMDEPLPDWGEVVNTTI